MDASNPPEITPELLAENPMLALVLTGYAGFVFLFFFGVLASLFGVGYRVYHGRALLPVEPWSPRVWGFADIVVTIVGLVLIQSVLAIVGAKLMGIDLSALGNGDEPPLSLTAVIGASYLVTMLCATLWLLARYRVSWSHLGYTIKHVPQGLLAGLVAGFLILPVVLVVGGLVSTGFDTEYKHPVLESMKADGTLGSYLLAVFTAAIAAPIAEEFLFRVLLQGWMQSLPFSSLASAVLGGSKRQRGNPATVFFHPASAGTLPHLREGDELEPSRDVDMRDVDMRGVDVDPAHLSSAELNTTDSNSVVESQASGDSPVSSVNPYEAPDLDAVGASFVGRSEAEAGFEREDTADLVPPIWPAILTGILFGLAHWGYGLSFVPLIVLGIVLGLLYRATHSIWPCILVHFMLNASSMITLGVAVMMEQARP